jgi:hypothetical protein
LCGELNYILSVDTMYCNPRTRGKVPCYMYVGKATQRIKSSPVSVHFKSSSTEGNQSSSREVMLRSLTEEAAPNAP